MLWFPILPPIPSWAPCAALLLALACGLGQPAAARDPPTGATAAAPREATVQEAAREAATKGADSGLPLPRFVSLAADKVNARTGPGQRYPIAWQYQRRGLPVEVVAEYEYWRRIRERDGTETWVHKNLTSGKRFALVDGTVRELFKKPDGTSEILLTAEPGVQGRLRRCLEGWCQIEIGNTRGWMPRGHLWGIYPNESFE